MSGFQDINILPLIKQFNLVNFVETGCYTGDGIAHAIRNGMRNIYSCDVGIQYVQHCKQHFPQAGIYHLSSKSFLTDIVDVIPGNCLFWLDAHLGGHLYNTGNMDVNENLPLKDEVDILARKDGVEKDLIIIDDTRIINSDDNFTFDSTLPEEYQMTNLSIKYITDSFPKHKAELQNWQQGVLFLTPKC